MKKLFLFILFILFCTVVHANDIYVAQSSAGSDNGTSCSNAYAMSFTTSSGNWGSGGGQIGPGTTLHICGTILGAAGDTALTVLGSGTSGNPITILFENGANMTNSGYWTNGIYIGTQNYITINGGVNGIIQNTGNGTGLAYDVPSIAIQVYVSTGITIENLTIANICQHTSYSDTNACNSGGNNDDGILLIGVTTATIANNTIHDTQVAINMEPPIGTNNITISNNIIYNCNWGVGLGFGSENATTSGFTISGNDISNAVNWDDADDTFHHNGIILFNLDSTQTIEGIVVANNYIHGDMGIHETSHIFFDSNGGPIIGTDYNNVLADANGHNPSNAYMEGTDLYNNTIIGQNGGIGIGISNGATVINNIMANLELFITIGSGSATINNNIYMNGIPSGCTFWNFDVNCGGQATFPEWQTACSCDSNGSYQSTTSVNANGTLQSGSPTIGAGENLTSIGISGLDSDIVGHSRPGSGNWDVGAYNYTASVNSTTTLNSSTLKDATIE